MQDLSGCTCAPSENFRIGGMIRSHSTKLRRLPGIRQSRSDTDHDHDRRRDNLDACDYRWRAVRRRKVGRRADLLFLILRYPNLGRIGLGTQCELFRIYASNPLEKFGEVPRTAARDFGNINYLRDNEPAQYTIAFQLRLV